jgi:CRISPR-associated protein Cst2
MAKLEGGAKQSIHYTDVSPVVVILAITKGGNHIFGHVIGENRGRPEVNLEALKESLHIFNDEIVSDIFIGWVHGYSEEERTRIETFANNAEAKTENGKAIKLSHPREAFQNLIAEMKKPENISWLE